MIEFFWDERSGIAYYLYENPATGELTSEQALMPLQKPEVDDDLRASYFATLKFWLDTQPLYD
jgi:hypothetical protein